MLTPPASDCSAKDECLILPPLKPDSRQSLSRQGVYNPRRGHPDGHSDSHPQRGHRSPSPVRHRRRKAESSPKKAARIRAVKAGREDAVVEQLATAEATRAPATGFCSLSHTLASLSLSLSLSTHTRPHAYPSCRVPPA